MTDQRSIKRKVVIIGGGAAGMSCASTLANHPEKFEVTLLEKADTLGGQATSIPLDEEKFGASWMNNGVQGGSSIFKHTFNFFRQQGGDATEVKLQVAFGKGKDDFWTNCFPSQLVVRYSSDIKRFGSLLSFIKWTLPISGLMPISLMLKVFLFKKDFGEKMVIPLIALFLGTGNQTAHVPCGIVERLFNDKNMKLWDYDSETLLPNLPTMYTFSNLSKIYESWKDDLRDRGVKIVTSTEVLELQSRSKNFIRLRVKDLTTNEEKIEEYSDMVLCVLADEALRILGKEASWRERFVLRGARFYDDITVTHFDQQYFQKYYETSFNPELHVSASSQGNREQGQANHTNTTDWSNAFQPMYYTSSYKEDPKLLEMSFNCSNYQHQFENKNKDLNAFEPVYQTIFLDKSRNGEWTIGEIDEQKIIKRNWWHQLGHRWQHYLRVVPGMMFLQGRSHTWFAGSWTLVNMHEVACVSGIAAAYHMGADYVNFDNFAQDFFSKYLLLSHGIVFSWWEKRKASTRA